MSAPVNEGNIIVGSGALKIGLGVAPNTSLGGTEDGVEFTMSKEFHDVEAAEAPVTLRKELTSLTGTISVGLLESTLDNLLLMWPGVEDPAGTVTIGTDGETAHDNQLEFVGKAPNGETRTVTFTKVIDIGDGGHRYTKGANTVIACEFEVLASWNSSDSRWDFGTIVDAA